MPYTSGALALMLDALAAVVDTLSLHTADPGGTGANEVTGGTYARQTVTWNAASGGNADNVEASILFDVPAGTTVTHVGYWDATGPTFYGSDALASPETFASAGQYELTDADLNLTSP